MIYTLTLNPSVDYYVTLPEAPMIDEVNRADHELYKAGGKGLNVSRILSLLAIPNRAIALLAGFTGTFIKEEMQKLPYTELYPIDTHGVNRINMKAHYGTHAVCINGSGPIMDECVENELFQILSMLNAGDDILISGSFPAGTSEDLLKRIKAVSEERKANLIIDMEKISLQDLYTLKPSLIKPNSFEFRLLTGVNTSDDSRTAEMLRNMNENGIDQILLSLGKEGALYCAKEGLFRLKQPDTELINKVGTGDAMLGTFIGMRHIGKDIVTALRYAGASGNATASKLEDITKEDIEKWLPLMDVQEERL